MKMEEHLLWIMDNPKDTYCYNEETVKRNIEFVHALGLKCDCVGWCSLDLNRPDINALLEQINTYVLKEGMLLRGWYSREDSDFESEWYFLESKYLSNDERNFASVTDRHGDSLKIEELYAYKVPKDIQVLWSIKLPLVNENIRNCCLNHGFSGLDFYWIRDIGRFHAARFYGLIIENVFPEFACDRYLSYSDSKIKGNKNYDHSVGSPLYQKYTAVGGKLPKLSQMFYDLHVNLPIQLPKNKMPETDFAYIYTYGYDYRKNCVLVSKHAAEILLSENAVRKEYLVPVVLYDTDPDGYFIQTSETIQYPAQEVIEKLDLDLEKLKSKPKPHRKVSEKDVIKLFRKTRRLRPEDFRRPMAKKTLATLTETLYGPLASYYSISDGGYLSDEYTFLSYSESLTETQEYIVNIKKEELQIDKYLGIVFAKCADGDMVVNGKDGSVKRISHETMEACENWDTIAQFFYEVLTDE